VIDRLRQRRDEANQRGLRIAAGIAEVEYQREVSIVDRDAGEVDETGDSLLRRRQSCEFSLSPPPRTVNPGGSDIPWIPQKAALSLYLR